MTEQRPLFVLPAAEATLVLDEGPFAGAEVDVRLNVAYAALREYRRLFAEWREAPDRSDEEAAAYAGMCALFAEEALVGWNLADHKGEIPATAEGMLRLPPAVALTVMGTWRGSIGRVMPPLPTGSPGTGEPGPSTNGSSSDGASPVRAGSTMPATLSIP